MSGWVGFAISNLFRLFSSEFSSRDAALRGLLNDWPAAYFVCQMPSTRFKEPV